MQHTPLKAALALACVVAFTTSCGCDHVPNASDTPAPGFLPDSMNVAVAEAPAARPAGQPCVVELFNEREFRDFSSSAFQYSPVCPGPWSKVLLQADFSVNAGRQFDRTGHISLGGVNLYTGTTQEPSASNAASWRIERDVTDYAQLFAQTRQGAVDLDNLVNDTYTGVLHGSARLLFYPQSANTPSPRSADLVLPLTDRNDGRPQQIKQSSPEYSQLLQLPRNSVRAYLDVLAQGQSDDEFWYTCAPDELSEQLQTCNGGALRQVLVLIDGKNAGLAPVMPWMFTGGVSPRLWRPIPGIQTLNMLPYRVDLSPFVGQLNDGQPHRLAVRIQNVRDYFNLSATLLLYRDPQQSVIPGRVLENTLADSQPRIFNNLLLTDKQPKGMLQMEHNTDYSIKGEIQTARGREVLQVEQKMELNNLQVFSDDLQEFTHRLSLETVSSVSTPYANSRLQRSISMPLYLNYADNGSKLNIRMSLGLISRNRLWWQNDQSWASNSEQEMNTQTMRETPSSTFSSTASQRALYQDSRNLCYQRVLLAKDAKLQSAQDSGGCTLRSLPEKPWQVQPTEWGDLWLALVNQ